MYQLKFYLIFLLLIYSTLVFGVSKVIRSDIFGLRSLNYSDRTMGQGIGDDS